MEMISFPMLLTKKWLDQRKKQFKLILMHQKKHLQILQFVSCQVHMCLNFKKYTFLASVVFINSVFIYTDVWKVI